MEMKPFMKVMIGEKRREEDLSAGYENDKRREQVNGIDFNGHRVLWGFSYSPHTYLKESELSGDEWRKGGWVRFFRNGVQVYEEFCREPVYAVFKVSSLLLKLMDFHWDKLKVGEKIYWRETPAVIKSLIPDQGCIIVAVDGSDRFPDSVWAQEDYEKLEDPREVKVTILDSEIWWWRK